LKREANIERKTQETEVALKLLLDGSGKYQVDTGIGFFDHMMALLIRHARFDCELHCKGDTYVDGHHSVEDCGIVLGEALKAALGDKAGIARYASLSLPMDEALIDVSLDVSGRPYFVYNVELEKKRTGDFDAELCEEFFRAVAMNAGLTLHINLRYGKNTHHIVEGVFKGVAHALRRALAMDEGLCGEVLSTKGVL